MRIGVYCGSFDPIHTGHAMVANYLAQYGGLDEVWLMVSRHNPLKVGRDPASEPHRLAMVKFVAEGCSRVVASDFEFSLPVPSYTYVTLCRLRERFPQHKFVLIIGSDNWHNFNRWRDSESILREFGLIVYPRPGYDLPVEPSCRGGGARQSASGIDIIHVHQEGRCRRQESELFRAA